MYIKIFTSSVKDTIPTPSFVRNYHKEEKSFSSSHHHSLKDVTDSPLYEVRARVKEVEDKTKEINDVMSQAGCLGKVRINLHCIHTTSYQSPNNSSMSLFLHSDWNKRKQDLGKMLLPTEWLMMGKRSFYSLFRPRVNHTLNQET